MIARLNRLNLLFLLATKLHAAMESAGSAARDIIFYPRVELLVGTIDERPGRQYPADAEVTAPPQAPQQRERVCL